MRCALVILICLVAVTAWSAEITASSGSRVDMSNAVASASSGDTIWVPAGTYDYSDKLIVNKGIRFRVLGTNVIIRDNTSTDRATIDCIPPTGYNIRWEGFEFADAAAGAQKYSGFIQAYGTNNDSFSSGRLILKNCYFNRVNKQCVFWLGCWGLVTGTRHELRDGTFIAHYIYQDVSSYEGSDRVWSMATTNLAGKDVGVFIEDSSFNRPGPNNYAMTDAYFGAVYTVRSNIINLCWVEAHGTDSGGRRRGTRWMEIYNNRFSSNTYLANFRSGSGILYSNVSTNYTSFLPTPRMPVEAYRRYFPFSIWESATGTNGWDVNDGSNPYDSGTTTAGGELYATDSSKSWTANQWQGYTFHWTGVTNKYKATVILSNTATTLYLENSGATAILSGWSELTLSNNCTYQINKVIESFDQSGRCCGSLLSGETPTPVNDQIDDPLYEWANVGESGADIDFSTSTPWVRSGEHYFNDTQRPSYSAFTYPHPDAADPVDVVAPTRGPRIRGIRLKP